MRVEFVEEGFLGPQRKAPPVLDGFGRRDEVGSIFICHAAHCNDGFGN